MAPASEAFLPLDQVNPGAVLAADVKDARGNMLVGSGRVLTEEWLKRLQGRGVTHVRVLGAAAASPQAGGTSREAAGSLALQRLEAMFAKAPQEPLMQALAAAARQVLSERRT